MQSAQQEAYWDAWREEETAPRIANEEKLAAKKTGDAAAAATHAASGGGLLWGGSGDWGGGLGGGSFEQQQRAADATRKRAADATELRNLVFDDSAGISLAMVEKLIRAANSLAIQPLIDAACSVAATAINNKEVMEFRSLDTVEQVLFGVAARADGRPTVRDMFTLLKDVHSYQPELAAKIIAAARTNNPKEEGAPESSNEADALTAAKTEDRFWTFWSSGRDAVVREVAAAELEIRAKHEIKRQEAAAAAAVLKTANDKEFTNFEEFRASRYTEKSPLKTTVDGHTVTWNFNIEEGENMGTGTYDEHGVRLVRVNIRTKRGHGCGVVGVACNISATRTVPPQDWAPRHMFFKSANVNVLENPPLQ